MAWQLRKEATRGKRGRLQSTVVMGRKFCRGKCGRWRHLCDFPPRMRNGKQYAQSVCRVCHVHANMRTYYNEPPDRRLKRQERNLRWKEAQRRAAGIPTISDHERAARGYSQNQSTNDIMVSREPLDQWLAEMKVIRGWDNRDLERFTGMDESQFRVKGRQNIHLSIAEDICDSLGYPSQPRALWPDLAAWD